MRRSQVERTWWGVGSLAAGGIPLYHAVVSYVDVDSVHAWKKRGNLGQFAEKDAEAEKAQAEEERRQKELAGGMKVEDRCEVRVKEGADAKRGTVMFVGEWMCDGRMHAHRYTLCVLRMYNGVLSVCIYRRGGVQTRLVGGC